MNKNFEFRKTEIEDLDKIEEILNGAILSMKEMNLDQWQDGYPNIQSIIKDMGEDVSYVLIKDGEVIATSALTFEKELPYEKIEGEWLSEKDEDYAIIHRIAVDNKIKNNGYASILLQFLEEKVKLNKIKSMKVDTHEDNKPMRRFLEKNGYKYCGVIYLDREPNIGAKRVAYEKILEVE